MEKIVEKNWGWEHWLVNNEAANYCGKILILKPHQGFSMHFHDIKVETFWVESGTGLLYLIDLATGKLSQELLTPGKTIEIPRLKPHQIINDSNEVLRIFEFSTFHRDEDSYRVWREIPSFITK